MKELQTKEIKNGRLAMCVRDSLFSSREKQHSLSLGKLSASAG
jgi:hypothetical protein